MAITCEQCDEPTRSIKSVNVLTGLGTVCISRQNLHRGVTIIPSKMPSVCTSLQMNVTLKVPHYHSLNIYACDLFLISAL